MPGRCTSASEFASGTHRFVFESNWNPEVTVFLAGKRPQYRVGDAVTISYDPKDLRDAKLAEHRSRLDPWKGVLFISLPCGLFAALLVWVALGGLQS